jgi:hypothetical protein
VKSSGVDLIVLLLLGGLLALGLPHITRQTERRFWHPWINTGLLPLVIGMVVGPWLSEALRESLDTILALATATAGVLLGTQLRGGFLRRAGWPFLRRHSMAALALFHLAAVPSLLGLVFLTDLGWVNGVAWSGAIGALVVATSQRPPFSASSFDVNHRDVVLGHVAPAGWWNLIAILLAGAAMSLPLGRSSGLAIAVPGFAQNSLGATQLTMPLWCNPILEVLVPMGMGLVLGWLAQRARNREEAYLFLLAVLGVAGGTGLVLGSAPLFSGLLIGAVFVNVPQGRISIIERALEGMEQPVSVGTGLLAGLILGTLNADPVVWVLVGFAVVARWVFRGALSPTTATLSQRPERRMVPPGASGVLVVAILVSMGAAGRPLASAMAMGLVLLTVSHDLYELRYRRRALA